MTRDTRSPAGLGLALLLGAGLGVGLGVGCGARTELSLGLDASAPPPAVPERCDGLDDDGDGRIDEGIAPLACGIGVCRVEIPGCSGGRVPECRPRPPGAESCNDLDDDCDGRADEGLGFGDRREVALVRDAEEGRTGACDTCAWAAEVSLAPTDEGLLAAWRVGFNGSSPQPNVYARPLDSSGRPRGEIRVVMEQNMTQGPRLRPSLAGQLLMTYCGRQGGDDLTFSRLLDAEGAPRSEGVRRPIGMGCGAAAPDGLWSGARHLFAWTDNVNIVREIYFDAGDEALRSVDARLLSEIGDLSAPPRLAVGEGAEGEGAVGMIAGLRPEPRVSELSFRLFDLEGNELREEQRFVAPEETFIYGETAIAYAPGEGFLAISANRERAGGLAMLLVAPDGRPRRDPWVIQPGVRFDRLDLAYAAGTFWLATLIFDGGEPDALVLRLDTAGELRDAWSSPHLWHSVSLVPRSAGMALLYAEGGSEGSRVWSRELGCVP